MKFSASVRKQGKRAHSYVEMYFKHMWGNYYEPKLPNFDSRNLENLKCSLEGQNKWIAIEL